MRERELKMAARIHTHTYIDKAEKVAGDHTVALSYRSNALIE